MDIHSMKFEEINEKIIEFLVVNKVQESIILEYKREPIDDSKLVKQIAAFANTKGGIIIIGVETNENDEPINLTPTGKKEKEKERIEQIINTGIMPIISGVRIKEILSLDDQSRCFYIIKIPMSAYGHMVIKNRNHRYYRRVYTRKNFQAVKMEEYEVAELYKKRFSFQQTAKSSILTKMKELKRFKIKGNALNVIIQPTIHSLSFLKRDDLYKLSNKMYGFSIPKSETTKNPTKNGFFWADELGVIGLTIEGSVMSRIDLSYDSTHREERVNIGIVIDIVLKTLKSAFDVYKSPSVNYFGGFILSIEIEDTIGRYLTSETIPRFIEPKKCTSQSVVAEIIQNCVEGVSRKSILNDLLKEFIGEFGLTADYSKRILESAYLNFD